MPIESAIPSSYISNNANIQKAIVIHASSLSTVYIYIYTYTCSKSLAGVFHDSLQKTPDEVYQLMLDCWDEDNIKRPTFAIIAQRVDELLLQLNDNK